MSSHTRTLRRGFLCRHIVGPGQYQYAYPDAGQVSPLPHRRTTAEHRRRSNSIFRCHYIQLIFHIMSKIYAFYIHVCTTPSLKPPGPRVHEPHLRRAVPFHWRWGGGWSQRGRTAGIYTCIVCLVHMSICIILYSLDNLLAGPSWPTILIVHCTFKCHMTYSTIPSTFENTVCA